MFYERSKVRIAGRPDIVCRNYRHAENLTVIVRTWIGGESSGCRIPMFDRWLIIRVAAVAKSHAFVGLTLRTAKS